MKQEQTDKIQVLNIIGSVGVGKTSVATAISENLAEKSVINAVIDLDCLRHAFPRPSTDWFHSRLGYKNLAAIWPNYKEVGVTHVIIPNVTENRSTLEEFHKAIPNANIIVVRLRAPVEVVHERLRGREKGKSLEWHLNRAVELTEQLERKRVEDFVVDTEGKTVEEIAKEILERINWI